ncbi:hypothetical protein HU200_019618 [Digitaria exilis]|uniref:UspA domain-containing protein n=1 Tax=Digitaria exilis TaxID=1010633 RepID=A0A835F3M8_9POAL|nr:hypothetical protein HU200_019618 [Digitaria exilis]
MAGAGGERWVGLATDFSEGSRAALRWAADNLLRTGDQLLLLHVIKEPNYEQSEAILWESTGSRTYASPHPLPQFPSSDRSPLACLLSCDEMDRLFSEPRADSSLILSSIPHCFGLLIVAALIPLSDFSDPLVAKKYGAKADAETLDLLNTVAKEKEVVIQILCLFSLIIILLPMFGLLRSLKSFWKTGYGGCQSPLGRSSGEAMPGYERDALELLGHRKQRPGKAQEVASSCSHTVCSDHVLLLMPVLIL